ncbi:MAG: Fe-S cluster assembly ATPase SufC [Minisyncoccota bacterium]
MSELEIKNISVETAGKRVVDDVSFILASKQVHILMGPNGSGKSSLVGALFGHPRNKIVEGKLFLEGEDITALPTEKKAKHGLFLSLQYLPSVAGVTLGAFLHRAHKELTGETISVLDFYRQAEGTARMIGIDPGFLKRDLNSGLSGGEKKQSEILQLAILKPKFAVLDEIDSGVDVDSLAKVFAAIELLRNEGTGFLLITHYPNILERSAPDMVHIMNRGKIVTSGGVELAREVSVSGFGNYIQNTL